MKRKLTLAAAVLLLLGLFLGARQAASWRPKLIGQQQHLGELSVSLDGRFVSTTDDEARAATSPNRVYDFQSRRWIELSSGAWSGGWTDRNQRVELSEGGGASRVRLLAPPDARPVREFGATTGEAKDKIQDFTTSDDGRFLWVVTTRYWHHFDLSSGKLLDSRLWNRGGIFKPLDGEWGEATLCPDKTQILARAPSGQSWMVVDARSGKLVRRFRWGAERAWSVGEGLVWTWNQSSDACAMRRFSDGATLWRGSFDHWECWTSEPGKTRPIVVQSGTDLEWRDKASGRVLQRFALSQADYEQWSVAPDASFWVWSDGAGRIYRQRLRLDTVAGVP